MVITRYFDENADLLLQVNHKADNPPVIPQVGSKFLLTWGGHNDFYLVRSISYLIEYNQFRQVERTVIEIWLEKR